MTKRAGESKRKESSASAPRRRAGAAKKSAAAATAAPKGRAVTTKKSATGPFIVGVGASAGGLEALTALVSNVNFDSLAFVIIQHLAPDHESALTQLLAKSAPIEVLTASDGMKVEANHIYVIPPKTNLAIMHGKLQLIPLVDQTGPRLPVDFFFRSLAGDQGERAIGIILSGTGVDGTEGLKAIKQAGGITFAQTPDSAKFGGMPRSAIDSGWADVTLAPRDIAVELMRIGSHPYLRYSARPTTFKAGLVDKLLVMVRDTFGNDLTEYKRTTIERRIERRLALHKIERLADYLRFVQTHPVELAALYGDLLISVTAFFRDREVFEALKTTVFPKLLEGKQLGSALRIWVPACSTGEEVYSVAIALLEYLGDRASDYRIQLFGTDIDEHSLQIARRALYPPNVALDVSAERLSRFFIAKDQEFQIARRVRDLVVFSNQNIAKDAPFSRLDLVSCRNLLIYLQPALQRRVMQVLHYSLLPGGFLVLGPSETIGSSPELFSLLDRKHKFYVAKQARLPDSLDVTLGIATERPRAQLPLVPPQRSPTTVAMLADRKILDLYGPPGVLLNDDLEVLQFRGQTGPYLAPVPGVASLSVLRLARSELRLDLRRLLKNALVGNRRTEGKSQIQASGELRTVGIEVLPINDSESRSHCLLVLFHEHPAQLASGEKPVTAEPSVPREDGSVERRLSELEQDLALTRDYLQNTIEELETANEELKASNEELQSSNEELQSTNEELETSKEELQSSNEELSTVNEELHHRMLELQETHEDLQIVLRGVESAVVVVGPDLRLRRFTTSAEGLLHLLPADVGRPVNLLNTFLPAEHFEEICAEVLESESTLTREVVGGDRRRYLLRVAPYRLQEAGVAGVIILLSLLDGSGPRRLTEGSSSKDGTARGGGNG